MSYSSYRSKNNPLHYATLILPQCITNTTCDRVLLKHGMKNGTERKTELLFFFTRTVYKIDILKQDTEC